MTLKLNVSVKLSTVKVEPLTITVVKTKLLCVNYNWN